MTLAAAQAFFYNPTDGSLTVDDSPYEVVRWPSQPLTFANPSGQPRIDLVVATPAMVDADSQPRNVLVDPVARTVTPQNVFKTTNPQATLAVVTGTPGATPLPPATPAGAVALFEVYVPVSAADSTAFGVVPRIFRRAPYPWSTMNGVISGRKLTWDLTADPTTTSSTLSAPSTLGASPFEVLIDGEVITSGGPTSTVAGIVSQDAGAANPFASAAPATFDKPFYVYAVGGRHCPQGNFTGGAFCPLAFVESTVPPDRRGKPTSSITTPRGSTTTSDGRGAVLVGIGFVVANTTFRRGCIMTDDMVLFGSDPATNKLTVTRTGAAADSLGAPPAPAISSKVSGLLSYHSATPGSSIVIMPDNGAGAVSAAFSVGTGLASVGPTSTGTAASVDENVVLPASPGQALWVMGGVSGDITILYINGYAHEVRRVAGIV
jgi:hypothetical protein